MAQTNAPLKHDSYTAVVISRRRPGIARIPAAGRSLRVCGEGSAKKGSVSRRLPAWVALSMASGVVAAAPADKTRGRRGRPPAPPPKVTPAKVPKTTASTDLTGSWTGPINQVGRATPYAIDITLAGKTGQTSYPDQHCTGKLTRVGSSGDYLFFIETITDGKFDPTTKAGCLDGSMTLQRDGTGLVIAWMTAHDGKAIVAYGALAAKKK